MTVNVPALPLLSSETPDVTNRTLTHLRQILPEENIGLVDDFSTQELAKADVAIAANPTAQMLNAVPNLVWVQSLWAGVENLLDSARERNFQIVRLIDPALADSMAEAALAWVLYLHRRMPDYKRQQHNHHWHQLPTRTATETEVTLLGLGELGRACAQRLQANGYSVSGWSASKKSLPNIECYYGDQQLPRALANTNILLVLLPLTETTNNLINKHLLAHLPNGAALINFARGGVVHTADMLMALGSGKLQHAVLDVFTEEPLPMESPLWDHPNITLLPHIAAPTDPNSATAIAAEHIRTYRQTGKLPPTVDLARGF